MEIKFNFKEKSLIKKASFKNGCWYRNISYKDWLGFYNDGKMIVFMSYSTDMLNIEAVCADCVFFEVEKPKTISFEW